MSISSAHSSALERISQIVALTLTPCSAPSSSFSCRLCSPAISAGNNPNQSLRFCPLSLSPLSFTLFWIFSNPKESRFYGLFAQRAMPWIGFRTSIPGFLPSSSPEFCCQRSFGWSLPKLARKANHLADAMARSSRCLSLLRTSERAGFFILAASPRSNPTPITVNPRA